MREATTAIVINEVPADNSVREGCSASNRPPAFISHPGKSPFMPTCPECGAELDSSDRFCPECGRSLDDVDLEEHSEDEQQGPDRVDIPANPHELDVFEFSFKYPLANGFKQIALAGLLLLGFFLIVPIVIFAGYQYRVGRSAAIGRSSPPLLEDFWGLLADGFRLVVAVGIAALVVGAVTVGLALAGLETLAFAWNTLASFCLAALTPVFYGTGSVSDTYANFRFLRFLGEVKFWIGFAYQLGITFVLYIAFFVITLVLIFTLVGILALVPFWIGFFVYATLVQAALWGRIYRDAAEEDQVDGVRDPDRLASTW